MAANTKLGQNVAHDDDSYNKPQVAYLQLKKLKELGCSKIRINIPTYLTQDFNHPFRDKLRAIALVAKSMGFYVIMGYLAFPLNSGNFAAFKQACRDGAIWCAANGIDEFTSGNEEDLNTGFAQATLMAKQQEVNHAIIVIDGTDVIASSAITTNVNAIWTADVANWSVYMKLNQHIYGILGAAHFDSYVASVPVALGAANVYCGEFGIDGGRATFGNDLLWATELKRRARLFEFHGWESFYAFGYAIQYSEAEAFKWSLTEVRDNYLETVPLRMLHRARPTRLYISP